jgi:hypothetical protein
MSSTITLPPDIQAIVDETIRSLQRLAPSAPKFVSDEIKDAIFGAIDAINKDMRALNLAIHGDSNYLKNST